MTASKKTILYIDDDPDDRELLNITIGDLSPQLKLVEAENGLKGLEYLNHAKDSNELPCLVVIDINMPLLDGRQTLDRIREDELLKGLPVVIFTSSENPHDRSYFNRRGVQMISKPMDVTYLKKIAQNMISMCG